jgi:hypothetical protein
MTTSTEVIAANQNALFFQLLRVNLVDFISVKPVVLIEMVQ